MAEPRKREGDFRPGDPREEANVEDPNLRNTTRFRGETRMPPERVRDERREVARPDESSNPQRKPMAVRTAEIVEDQGQSQWFGRPELEEYRSRWISIQTAFVDAPRQAVKDAADLIQALIRKLSDSFTDERERLTKQWDRGEQVSTEDLRVTLQRYRTYFDRL